MKRLRFILIVGFVFYVACYEQNTNAQNAQYDAQRIVGAWSNEAAQRIAGTWSADGGDLVFTFDIGGTYKVTSKTSRNRKEGNYLISNAQIVFKNSTSMTTSFPSDYYFSADEKVLVFKYTFVQGSGEWNQYIWLIKQ